MLWDYDSSVIVLLLRLNRGAVSLESHYDLSLPEYKVGDKDEAQDDQCRIELLPLSGAELEDDVAQDAEADTVGDRVAEHHRDHRDEGGEGFADIGEVEELHRVEHQHADKDECATCRRAGDEQEDGGSARPRRYPMRSQHKWSAWRTRGRHRRSCRWHRSSWLL